MQITSAVLPLMKGYKTGQNIVEAIGFIGSATIVGNNVCTCAHVVQSVDFKSELILTKWNPDNPNEPWQEFIGAKVHKKYDFAVLQTINSPPNKPLPLSNTPLEMSQQVYGIGFHDDGECISPEGRRNFQVAPRSFFGNVVRVDEQVNNFSPSLCELSFATLSGFSGAPVFSPGLDSIIGMIYGNVDQKIQVHQRYELIDGDMKFSETVNRIMELGLFHSAKSIKTFLKEVLP